MSKQSVMYAVFLILAAGYEKTALGCGYVHLIGTGRMTE